MPVRELIYGSDVELHNTVSMSARWRSGSNYTAAAVPSQAPGRILKNTRPGKMLFRNP